MHHPTRTTSITALTSGEIDLLCNGDGRPSHTTHTTASIETTEQQLLRAKTVAYCRDAARASVTLPAAQRKDQP